MSRNQHWIAERGREPGLRLERGVEAMAPAAWGRELLAQCEPIAAALDAAHGGTAYREVLAAAAATLADFPRLPSARLLEETEARYGRSYPALALACSERHRDSLLATALDAGVAARYAQMAAESIAEQQAIEAADDVPFETFRERYLAQDMVSGAHFRAAG